MKYILAIDQGTTSSRAILFDSECNAVDCVQQEFPQHFPEPGLVEHDPEDIWNSVRQTAAQLIARNPGKEISAIGITNQRETTVVWDAATGKAVHNAIVWQDRRTAEFCTTLKRRASAIRRKTGLIPDAYFSGTKVKWILDNVPEAGARAAAGTLRFGTVDSFLIWRLTSGRVHATDVTNASRTMLFNINTMKWDEGLLKMLEIPESMLPEVKENTAIFGYTHGVEGIPDGIPISGVAGDQQASLFGQMCLRPGDVKNTYGTGCFLLMNCGQKPLISRNKLLTTVAWSINGNVNYALEGSIFVAGSVVQWLRDGLGIIKCSSEVEELAGTVEDSGGVVFVPALTGLGAPYWAPAARGTIRGITRGTTAAHIARAALEGIAFETYDVMQAMARDAGIPVSELKVDGGASRNNLLMQFQADILGVTTVRPKVVETTALGAALLAGLGTGIWKDTAELENHWQQERRFVPQMPREKAADSIARWHRAIDLI
ncbi:MAG: glycerol kinase GlpK [Bacteroidales bacterium]|nr:glycerol kinase GlpK [Bacteroidales bacterium]